jgi:cytochrome b561
VVNIAALHRARRLAVKVFILSFGAFLGIGVLILCLLSVTVAWASGQPLPQAAESISQCTTFTLPVVYMLIIVATGVAVNAALVKVHINDKHIHLDRSTIEESFPTRKECDLKHGRRTS